MLVLSRKVSEKILVGDDVVITVVRIGPNLVRLGIDAPGHMNIVREELADSKTVESESVHDDPHRTVEAHSNHVSTDEVVLLPSAVR